METNTLSSFFRGDYMPHGHCYLWQPHILWTNVISDFLIALAYFSLPVAIMLFSMKRQDIQYKGVFVLFSLFILCCGITHVFGIFTIWHGIYGVHGLSKAVTALVSIITAVYVYKVLPTVLTLPTIAQFEDVKDQLTVKNAAVTALETELANQKLVKFILNSIPVSTLMLNKAHQVVFYNQTFYDEYFPYLQRDITEQSLFDFIRFDPDLAAHIKQEQAGNQTGIYHLRTFLVSGDDREIPVELSLEKAEFEGEFVSLLTLKNLTEVTEIKNELLESHHRLERAISATEDGIWEWNVKNNKVNYSPKLMELIGKSEIMSPSFEDWYSHIHPDYRDKVDQAIEHHFATKEQYFVEYLGLDKHQKYSWFVSIGNSIFDEKGNPSIMLGSLRNIDKTKKLEELYQEKSDFLNAIYYGANHAIWVISVTKEKDFVFEEYNDTACKWTGVNQGQVLGKPLTTLTGTVFPQEVADGIREHYQRCLVEKTPLDYIESLVFDGQKSWYKTTLYPIFDDQENVSAIVGTAIDITQQKQGEIALAEHQAFLETIINSTVCGLYLFDIKQNKNITVNKRYTDLLGYTAEDIQAMGDVKQHFHPDDLSKIEHHIKHVINTKSKQLVPIEYRFKHKDGRWVWCYSVDCVVKRDKNDEPEIVLGTFVDITEQTTLLQKLQESNAYLERFAFVASHDLQEPLRKITAFSGLLKDRLAPLLSDDKDADFEFSRLISAAERMQIMIKDILKLSRINTSSINIAQCQLTNIVNEAMDRLSYLIEQSQAKIVIDAGHNTFFADEALLVQVLQNLLGNAIKFAKRDQTPIIKISLQETDTEILITCQDNGIGIATQYQTQIFEPFRKLHAISEYAGSGIGLAICQQIMKVHEGSIECQSEIGEGTRFILHLPKQGALYA